MLDVPAADDPGQRLNCRSSVLLCVHSLHDYAGCRLSGAGAVFAVVPGADPELSRSSA